MKHEDQTLNILRIFAFAAVGLYLYKFYRKEGSLGSVTKNPAQFGVNTGKVFDSVMPWINVNDQHRELIRQFGKEAVDGYLRSKGVQVHG